MDVDTVERVVDGVLDGRWREHVRWRQGERRFIVELADPGRLGMAYGQVADLDWGLLYSPVPVGSIIARGYWEELDAPVAAADVLDVVKPE